MVQRAQRFFVDSHEGFTFQEEREYSDKLDYEQEQADLDKYDADNLTDNMADPVDAADDDDLWDDIDTWTEWDSEDDLLDL